MNTKKRLIVFRAAWLLVLAPLPVAFVLWMTPIERSVGEPTAHAIQGAIDTCGEAIWPQIRECRLALPPGLIKIHDPIRRFPEIASLRLDGPEDGTTLYDCTEQDERVLEPPEEIEIDLHRGIHVDAPGGSNCFRVGEHGITPCDRPKPDPCASDPKDSI